MYQKVDSGVMISINSGPFGEWGEEVVSEQNFGAFRDIDVPVRNQPSPELGCDRGQAERLMLGIASAKVPRFFAYRRNAPLFSRQQEVGDLG